MNTFDRNEWMRLKTCEQKRVYYHAHKKYCKNKNKSDYERNKKRYSKDPVYIVLKKNWEKLQEIFHCLF